MHAAPRHSALPLLPAGSDDMNVRIWKTDASQQLGTLLPRERHKAAYNKVRHPAIDGMSTGLSRGCGCLAQSVDSLLTVDWWSWLSLPHPPNPIPFAGAD